MCLILEKLFGKIQLSLVEQASAGPQPVQPDSVAGRDADLVVVVDCQIPADDLVVHIIRL
ncbi:hypothetical protein [Escherichia coli]|uniref:hypothetical protein n=1 Tax=Escherichia coli TaxID=562 RepID=UPI00093E148C|nr:hypothetical protein [Escherichia coli]EGD4893887.1 hypothetical protein [Shigella boydii]EGE0881918.1 hypothetical protein [Shigella boydii]EGE1643194.1 hypothetical protein [Shigella boydii]MBB2641683.1 hypothetical protein [Escherichia coli]